MKKLCLLFLMPLIAHSDDNTSSADVAKNLDQYAIFQESALGIDATLVQKTIGQCFLQFKSNDGALIIYGAQGITGILIQPSEKGKFHSGSSLLYADGPFSGSSVPLTEYREAYTANINPNNFWDTSMLLVEPEKYTKLPVIRSIYFKASISAFNNCIQN